MRPEGLAVRIVNSNSDREGQGQVIAISRVTCSPYCPAQAVSSWLVAAAIETGAVFRRMYRGDAVGTSPLTGKSVALVIKALAAQVGLDPARYAGHSLRSGFLTSTARNRASFFKMADQSRHKSFDVLRKYVREEDQFENHPAAGLLQSVPPKRPR